MKPLFSFSLIALLCFCLLPAACRLPQRNAGPGGAATFREGFEAGDKRAYTAAKVELSTGAWLLDGALIGTSEADLKSGAASLRLRSGGYAEMLYDLDGPLDTLSFRFGPFGSERDARISLWYSNNSGKSWKKYSGEIGHHGDGYAEQVIAQDPGFDVPVRFRLRNDGSGRVNIDDFGAGGLPHTLPGRKKDAPERRPGNASSGSAGTDVNLLLGNPSNATADVTSNTNYLLQRPQYALSYNNERGTANWVSWHLSMAEQGSAPRCNCFSADAALPEVFFRAQSSNYIGSGFDRGHICASDDRSGSPQANAATFLMTNIAPQAPDMNQKSWRLLEEYARRLTEDGKELYIISGCYGEGGTGSKGAAKRIGNGRITVPAHFWKILLVLPEGDDDLRRIDANTGIIAVDMPNTQGAGRYDWQSFRCTISSLERATGYRFFSALPADVADALRRK